MSDPRTQGGAGSAEQAPHYGRLAQNQSVNSLGVPRLPTLLEHVSQVKRPMRPHLRSGCRTRSTPASSARNTEAMSTERTAEYTCTMYSSECTDRQDCTFSWDNLKLDEILKRLVSLEARVQDIPEILTLIRNFQGAASQATRLSTRAAEFSRLAAERRQTEPIREASLDAEEVAASVRDELRPWLKGELQEVQDVALRTAEFVAQRMAVQTAEWVTKLMGEQQGRVCGKTRRADQSRRSTPEPVAAERREPTFDRLGLRAVEAAKETDGMAAGHSSWQVGFVEPSQLVELAENADSPTSPPDLRSPPDSGTESRADSGWQSHPNSARGSRCEAIAESSQASRPDSSRFLLGRQSPRRGASSRVSLAASSQASQSQADSELRSRMSSIETIETTLNERIRELFCQVDQNGDESISREQARRFFSSTPFGCLSVGAMFDQVDMDKDGLISWPEFRDFWKSVWRHEYYSTETINEEIGHLLERQAWPHLEIGRQVTPTSNRRASRVPHVLRGISSQDTELDLMSPSSRVSRAHFRSKSRGVLASFHESRSHRGAGAEEDRTSKALIVNFRRLIKMKEVFNILHEIMKSTTIAFLTLMLVKSPQWLACDLLSLVACVGLYALHANKFDTLEVADYNILVELLGDDGESELSKAPSHVENPNRWLQAVTYSRTGLRMLCPYLCLVFYLVLVILSWSYVIAAWADSAFVVTHFNIWPKDELEHPVTLLLVGTLMLLCHLCFELMYWRETQYCMPLKDGRPWRLDEDGVPRDWHFNHIFGQPCIWFTTPQAYDDLRIWVTLASGEKSSHHVRKNAREQFIWPRVFFEELALYAIQDETSATRLRRSLLQARLFDKKTDSFLSRQKPRRGAVRVNDTPHITMCGVSSHYGHGRLPNNKVSFHKVDVSRGDMPEELGLDLLFYDNRSDVYWAPDSLDIEVFKDKVVSHQLRKNASLTPRGSSGSAETMDMSSASASEQQLQSLPV